MKTLYLCLICLAFGLGFRKELFVMDRGGSTTNGVVIKNKL